MNHNVGREYETCRSFAIVWIRWWIDNEWINWFFYSHLSVVIWFPLMDWDNFGAVWVMVKRTVQPGSGRSTTVTRTERYRSQINSFLFAPLWWMRLDPRRKRYFVFPLIPGNKIVVNNDDNVHIVPIQCTRHPTMAHYNNPQKQYISEYLESPPRLLN